MSTDAAAPAAFSDAERVTLTTGVDYWTTAAAEPIGLRALRLADGPHGLRIQDDNNPDHLGLGRSLPATCFPPAVTLASSWNRELVAEVGEALGREARAGGVDVLLGPGMNIKRTPLCGRNFEYFSEDPLLTGALATAMIRGIQSTGVAACVKHFAANNQETDRLRVNAQVDDRTLREIYLRGFQLAIRDATPWALMSAYNKVNGTYASENPWLLNTVLRDEWGYDGVVVSDWGAVGNPVASLEAGLDLRMPGRPDDTRVAEALQQGALDTAALRNSTERLRLLAERTTPSAQSNAETGAVASVDFEAQHLIARRAASDSAVLLSNDGTLPLQLSSGSRIAVIGELARTPRIQGAGSSAVNPTRTTSGLDALSEVCTAGGTSIAFAAGYSLTDSAADTAAALVDEATALAADVDVVVLFLGLPAQAEAEGRDRDSIDLPTEQLQLLAALAETSTPVVVALSNGSVVSTASWRDSANAIVEFWLTGQAHGEVIADVLLGAVNPSGKLAETVPVRLADTPAFLHFPGENGTVHYGEGVYVGYRYYDARGLDVDFPFGHGLSYTSFEYSELSVVLHDADAPVAATVSFELRNNGDTAGAEVAQLYVAEREHALVSGVGELRDFAKVWLEPGQSRRVSFAVTRDSLAHYDTALADWAYEGGKAEFIVGSSSRDIRLSSTELVPGERRTRPLSVWSTLRDWQQHPELGSALAELIEARGGLAGRLADLLADPVGQDSVLEVPMAGLVEFPGVPVSANDLELLLSGAAA